MKQLRYPEPSPTPKPRLGEGGVGLLIVSEWDWGRGGPWSVIETVKDLRELAVLRQTDQDLDHVADTCVTDDESV